MYSVPAASLLRFARRDIGLAAMNKSWSPEIEAFRREVRDFIRTHLPDDIRCQVAESAGN